MRSYLYHIISEETEDSFGETDNLEEAIRMARSAASAGQAGEQISIEHKGFIIRHLVRQEDGTVVEEEIR